MRKILIGACMLALTAQSFGQVTDTASTLKTILPVKSATLTNDTQNLVLNAINTKKTFENPYQAWREAQMRQEYSTKKAAGINFFVVAPKPAPVATAHFRDTIYTFKKQWPVYACFFGAGLAYGTAEGLIWHTNNSKNAFWNPYKSWRTGQVVDGYHAARAAGIGCFMAAAALSVSDVKHPFTWGMLKKVAISSIAYWAGQQITWHTVR